MSTEHPKSRGEKSEAAVLHDLISRNITVLQPFGDNERYDFAVEIDGIFHRIQVKTGRVENGSVQFETRSTGTLTRQVKKEGYDGDADYFAVYSPHFERTFVVPVSEAPATTMRLRVRDAKKESPNINRAENYTVSEWVEDVEGDR